MCVYVVVNPEQCMSYVSEKQSLLLMKAEFNPGTLSKGSVLDECCFLFFHACLRPQAIWQHQNCAGIRDCV